MGSYAAFLGPHVTESFLIQSIVMKGSFNIWFFFSVFKNVGIFQSDFFQSCMDSGIDQQLILLFCSVNVFSHVACLVLVVHLTLL